MDQQIVLVDRDLAALSGRTKDLDNALVHICCARAITPRHRRVDPATGSSAGDTINDPIAQPWVHQFPATSNVALVITLTPFSIFGEASVATHGSPYDYDSHVPVIFMGAWFARGRYPNSCEQSTSRLPWRRSLASKRVRRSCREWCCAARSSRSYFTGGGSGHPMQSRPVAWQHATHLSRIGPDPPRVRQHDDHEIFVRINESAPLEAPHSTRRCSSRRCGAVGVADIKTETHQALNGSDPWGVDQKEIQRFLREQSPASRPPCQVGQISGGRIPLPPAMLWL